MNDITTLIQFAFLLVSHPLESIDVEKINFKPSLPIQFIDRGRYVAPNDGVVKKIIKNNGLYQVQILIDDESEIVYSGLNEVLKSQGDIVHAGDIIGEDKTINENTK
jgi:hypothetical protein